MHFDEEGYWWTFVDQSSWVAKADAAWRGREKGGAWKVARHEAGLEIRLQILRIEGTPASDWVAENVGDRKGGLGHDHAGWPADSALPRTAIAVVGYLLRSTDSGRVQREPGQAASRGVTRLA